MGSHAKQEVKSELRGPTEAYDLAWEFCPLRQAREGAGAGPKLTFDTDVPARAVPRLGNPQDVAKPDRLTFKSAEAQRAQPLLQANNGFPGAIGIGA